ncbi:hypothetical protein L345_07827, partial [Ophiophagus hannah]
MVIHLTTVTEANLGPVKDTVGLQSVLNLGSPRLNGDLRHKARQEAKGRCSTPFPAVGIHLSTSVCEKTPEAIRSAAERYATLPPPLCDGRKAEDSPSIPFSPAHLPVFNTTRWEESSRMYETEAMSWMGTRRMRSSPSRHSSLTFQLAGKLVSPLWEERRGEERRGEGGRKEGRKEEGGREGKGREGKGRERRKGFRQPGISVAKGDI